MRTRNLILAVAAAGLLGAIGYGLYEVGMNSEERLSVGVSGSIR